MTCRWTSSTTPRTLPGRHLDDCADRYDEGARCRGCLPCTEPHCRVCNRAHAAGACAECLADVRGNLHDIARMCDALPEEVESRGVDGEAMMLLGPAANPEARGHLEASVASGRVPADYLEDATHELHPLFVLGSWDMLWRAELEHDEPDVLTLAAAVDYLDRTMGYMATWPHVPFEDFARDLRRCAGHLEAVLHDGEQVDEGAPCMKCDQPLTRVWGKDDRVDGWECRRCHQSSTEAQYRYAVMNLYREEATHLTDQEMQLRTGVRAGTVRVWAQRGDVERKRDQGRTVYSVADVMARRSA